MYKGRSATTIYGRPWSYADYLIVLDAYFRSAGQPRHDKSEFIMSIARMIGRTPGSVAMRMENYASIDPVVASRRKGLAKVGQDCRRHFEFWNDKRGDLSVVAQNLRADRGGDVFDQATFFDNDVQIPRAFGKYELMDRLGEGGFGVVFSCLAEDGEGLKAIKIVRGDKINDQECIARFAREIKALRAIQSQNVIRMFEDNLDEERTFPGYVMELGDTSLSMCLQECVEATSEDPFAPRSTLPADEATNVLLQVLRGTATLHGHSPVIIHRDINPNNVLRMRDDRWVVADFGLVKFIGRPVATTAFATRTEANKIVGTAHYTAPEQYRSFKSAGTQADVYSLGMLIHDLFSTRWGSPDRNDSGIEGPLESIFQRCTERDPSRRFGDAIELLAAVESVI